MPGATSPAFSKPLFARVSALPVLAEHIEGLTSRQELWWRSGQFQLKVHQKQPIQCGTAVNFRGMPRIQLRPLIEEDDKFIRRLHANGFVEAVFARQSEPLYGQPTQAFVYVEWLLSLLIGVLAQVEHFPPEHSGMGYARVWVRDRGNEQGPSLSSSERRWLDQLHWPSNSLSTFADVPHLLCARRRNVQRAGQPVSSRPFQCVGLPVQ